MTLGAHTTARTFASRGVGSVTIHGSGTEILQVANRALRGIRGVWVPSCLSQRPFAWKKGVILDVALDITHVVIFLLWMSL